MVHAWYIPPLLLATFALAAYYIDNADPSIVYAMTPSTNQSGQPWQAYSVTTGQLSLQISNSTGNYTIILDASTCYDQNYALGVCGTSDGCYLEIPFTGSGIVMYVFNAGTTGMEASFSIDGTATGDGSVSPPTAAENYQVANVSIFAIESLPSGNHTLRMTLLDWNGGKTSMKFDHAYVNQTVVTSTSTTTLQVTAPAETSSTSDKIINTSAVVGATLGGTVALGILIGFIFYSRIRRGRSASPKTTSNPQPVTFVEPFTESSTPGTSPSQPYSQHDPHNIQHPDQSADISPFRRFAILRDAHAAGRYHPSEPVRNSQSTTSGPSISGLRLPHIPTSHSHGAESDHHASSSMSHILEAGSASFSDAAIAAQYNLTLEQFQVIQRLRADNVPTDTILRLIKGIVCPNVPEGEMGRGNGVYAESVFANSVSPPSYQTRDR